VWERDETKVGPVAQRVRDDRVAVRVEEALRTCEVLEGAAGQEILEKGGKLIGREKF